MHALSQISFFIIIIINNNFKKKEILYMFADIVVKLFSVLITIA